MGISRKASAHWEGDLKGGKGSLTTPQSGLLDGTRYGFNSRFGDEKGTNPEELIAAAHAGSADYQREAVDILEGADMLIENGRIAAAVSAAFGSETRAAIWS